MRTRITTFFLATLSWPLLSQPLFRPFQADLNSPLGVEVDYDDRIFVVEGGTGADDGQIWCFEPDGKGDVIVTDLPSFFNPEVQELIGPLNITLTGGNDFYVIQGEGHTDFSGTIMKFNLDDFHTKGAPLTPNDATEVVFVSQWALANGFEESNPYSMTFGATGNMMIVDAAANAIFNYDPATSGLSVHTTFPPAPNPLPFGPPFIDAVPTKIINYPGEGFLVSTLTGFPFIDGAANIYHVAEDGTSSIYSGGHTLLTDLAWDPQDGGLLALQFATFGEIGFNFGSAQLSKINDLHVGEAIATGFGPSPGMGVATNGDVYVSNLFTGEVLQWNRCSLDAGTISTPSGDDLTYCTGDGLANPFSVRIDGSEGAQILMVTDSNGMILDVVSGNTIDLEGSPVDKCFVYNLAYDGTLGGLTYGSTISDLTGCIDISNAITVNTISCEGCHAPINLKYKSNKPYEYYIRWDQVRDANEYDIQLAYWNDLFPNPFGPPIPVRRNSVKIRTFSNQPFEIRVRPRCGRYTWGDYSNALFIPANTSYSAAKSLNNSDVQAEFIVVEEEVDVYPNPASEHLYVSFDGERSGNINIYNISGQKVYAKTIISESIIKTQVEQLTPGLYMIEFVDKDGSLNRKRIVISR